MNHDPDFLTSYPDPWKRPPHKFKCKIDQDEYTVEWETIARRIRVDRNEHHGWVLVATIDPVGSDPDNATEWRVSPSAGAPLSHNARTWRHAVGVAASHTP